MGKIRHFLCITTMFFGEGLMFLDVEHTFLVEEHTSLDEGHNKLQVKTP